MVAQLDSGEAGIPPQASVPQPGVLITLLPSPRSTGSYVQISPHSSRVRDRVCLLFLSIFNPPQIFAQCRVNESPQ